MHGKGRRFWFYSWNIMVQSSFVIGSVWRKCHPNLSQNKNLKTEAPLFFTRESWSQCDKYYAKPLQTNTCNPSIQDWRRKIMSSRLDWSTFKKKNQGRGDSSISKALPTQPQRPAFSPDTHTERLVEHAGNPSTEEAEINNPGILASQPRLILEVKIPVESPCVKTLKL